MTQQLFRATSLGTLPEGSGAILGGVRLPPGKRVAPDPARGRRNLPVRLTPRLWVSTEPQPNAAAVLEELSGRFATTGLWPLVLESLGGADERPWLAGELDPIVPPDPATYDVSAIIAGWWNMGVPSDDEEAQAFAALEPFDREFPGLASVANAAWDRVPVREVAASLSGRLGLVPVTRPADVLASVGWTGPINHYSDMGALSAVLRSWEERFGAYLVGVGFDTITLAVACPPPTLSAALAIAAEHFAVCSDAVYQGSGSIEAYAHGLLDSESWGFWWD